MENKGLLPEDVELKKSSQILKSILNVYKVYQEKTKDLNAFDFGDLILSCVKLLKIIKILRNISKKLNIF